MDCHVAPLKKKREVKGTRDAPNNGDEAASASTLKKHTKEEEQTEEGCWDDRSAWSWTQGRQKTENKVWHDSQRHLKAR